MRNAEFRINIDGTLKVLNCVFSSALLNVREAPIEVGNGECRIVIPETGMIDHPCEFLDGAASVLAASVLIKHAPLIKQQAEQIARPHGVLARRPIGDDPFCEPERNLRIFVGLGDSLEMIGDDPFC